MSAMNGVASWRANAGGSSSMNAMAVPVSGGNTVDVVPNPLPAAGFLLLGGLGGLMLLRRRDS